MSLLHCPSCDERNLSLFLTAGEVESEVESREWFFHERLDGHYPTSQMKDITNLAFGVPAAIFRCPRCGTLVRDVGANDEDRFREDAYEPRALEGVHAAHTAAFRRILPRLRALLQSGSRVIEIGSYAGGFARVAAESGWRFTGIDIGGQTTRYTRRLGFETIRAPFEECQFEKSSADGIFIWNCFEQLPSPRSTLAEVARILKVSGLLVLRIPDARFYAAVRGLPASLELLGYNGLLGWPHRFGYDLSAVRQLCGASNLRFVGSRRSRAMRPHREAMHRWSQFEETASMSDAAHRGWLEVTFQKTAIDRGRSS